MSKLFNGHGIGGAAALVLISIIAAATNSLGLAVFVVFLIALIAGIAVGFTAGHNATLGAVFSVALLTFGLAVAHGPGTSGGFKILMVIIGVVAGLGLALVTAHAVKDDYGGVMAKLIPATLSLPLAVFIGIGVEWLSGWPIAWLIGLLYGGLMYWLASRVQAGRVTFEA